MGGRYGDSDFHKGENGSSSRIDVSEIVVKLPEGARTALSMDKFSAQLKFNSTRTDDLNPPDMDAQIREGESDKFPEGTSPNTGDVVGEEGNLLLDG